MDLPGLTSTWQSMTTSPTIPDRYDLAKGFIQLCQRADPIWCKWSHLTNCQLHILLPRRYLQTLDTAQWSRTVLPWTLWTVDPGKPERTRTRRPPRGPSGPALAGATLRKQSHAYSSQFLVCRFKASRVSQVSQHPPVSLEDAHSHDPVKLSNLQLYHRSDFRMPSHSHHDCKDRKIHVKHSRIFAHQLRKSFPKLFSLPSPSWQ